MNSIGSLDDSSFGTGSSTNLWNPAVSAVRCNPVIKVFAERLRAAGKPFKAVITACMRKLASFLNAMIRERITCDQLEVVKATKNTCKIT